MSISDFGHIDGEAVKEIVLRSAAGARVSLLTLGAIVRDFVVPTGAGEERRVVLGYENLDGYRDNPFRVGVIAGRCCNRISDKPLVLDGEEYKLAISEGVSTHLHGGVIGFARRNWTLLAHDERSALLQLVSEDGEEGYPGRVTVRCLYELCEPATLRMTFEAQADAPTWLNLTSHPYFTLDDTGDARDHLLQVFADEYLPLDEALIPTGEIRAVADTPYDFRIPRSLRSGGIDYDINFVVTGGGGALKPVARVTGADQKLTLEIASTQPGFQLYSASALSQTAPGIDGQRHCPYVALALETQHFPDAPHHPHFPSIVLRPGEKFHEVTEYRLLV